MQYLEPNLQAAVFQSDSVSNLGHGGGKHVLVKLVKLDAPYR